MKLLLCIVASVAASGIGQLLLRYGAMQAVPVSLATASTTRTWIALLFNPYVLLGLAAWAGSTLLWLIVLSRAELSYAYVLGSINYIIVPLLSRWLFDEQLHRIRLLGMAVIFLGILITIYGRHVEQQP